STRCGCGLPWTLAQIASTPACLAMSMTLPTPRCSVRSKNVTLREAWVACQSMQSGWQGAVLELRTGPFGLPVVRPLFGKSFTGGESQCDFGETFWCRASARSYTLKDEPGGCWPYPVGLPSES